MINLNDAAKRDGVLGALELLLRSKSGPIKTKNSENSDGVSSKLKMPQNVEIIDVDVEDKENGEEETEEEKQDRLSQAETDNSPETLSKDLKAIENEQKQAAITKKKKKEQEEQKNHEKEMHNNQKLISSGKFHLDYKWFFRDLENAINDQIEQTNKWEDSYDAFNATYVDSGALMPGEKRAERKQKPIINVYFDLSGSLSDSTIAKAKESLSFLTDLENSGDIEEYEVYYFAGEVNKDPNKVGWGTTAFPEILDHVKNTGADNVIIFTDSDFDRQSGDISSLPYVKIDGCMWWMWADGDTAKRAWPHLTSSNPVATYHYDIK